MRCVYAVSAIEVVHDKQRDERHRKRRLFSIYSRGGGGGGLVNPNGVENYHTAMFRDMFSRAPFKKISAQKPRKRRNTAVRWAGDDVENCEEITLLRRLRAEAFRSAYEEEPVFDKKNTPNILNE